MAQNVYMQTSNPSINNSNMAQNVYIQTPNPSINYIIKLKLVII